MNTSQIKNSAILVVAICLTATEAQACGEVMLRELGSMRYHSFVTHHPASILLYSGDSAAKRPPATDSKLHDDLEKAGHKVSVARGPDELAKALAAHHFDVLVAYAGDMANVTSQIAKASRELTLIPVFDSGTDEHQMRARFPGLVSGDLNDLLKAIEQATKALGI
jgi:hypothetical protein